MKTFTKDQLQEILIKHTKWLKSEKGGERADLSYANLRSADLRSANLRYADLSYANLRYADLRSADLSYANLRSADLRSANLRYADLSYANLRYADLIYFTFRKHTAYFTFDGKIRIGCENKEIKTWLKDYKKIGENEGYEKEEIMAYGVFIKLCSDLQKKHKAVKK